MACCIIAAFVIGQCLLAWRWLKTRFGTPAKIPAAMWSAAAESAPAGSSPSWPARLARRGPVIAWLAALGLATLAVAAVLAAPGGGIRLRHVIPPSAAWCFGDAHE